MAFVFLVCVPFIGMHVRCLSQGRLKPDVYLGSFDLMDEKVSALWSVLNAKAFLIHPPRQRPGLRVLLKNCPCSSG